MNTTVHEPHWGFKLVVRVQPRCNHGTAHRLFDWMRDPPGTVVVS